MSLPRCLRSLSLTRWTRNDILLSPRDISPFICAKEVRTFSADFLKIIFRLYELALRYTDFYTIYRPYEFRACKIVADIVILTRLTPVRWK